MSRVSYKGERIPANVLNKALYLKTRNKVKKRVKVWPSAYASGQVVSEYKKAGGKYKGNKRKGDSAKLNRWYKEKWVNVCKPKSSGGFAKCGRNKSSIKKYPYCRPSIRVTKRTPMTVNELKKKYSDKKLKELCKRKRKTGLPNKGKPVRIKVRKPKRLN